MMTAITGHLLSESVSKLCAHAITLSDLATHQYVLLMHESQLENVFLTPAASPAMSRCHIKVAMAALLIAMCSRWSQALLPVPLSLSLPDSRYQCVLLPSSPLPRATIAPLVS